MLSKPAAILLDIDNTVYAYAPCHEAGLKAAFLVSELSDEAEFRAAYAEAREQAKHAIADTGAAHCRLLYFKRLLENRLGRTAPTASLALYKAYWDGYHAAMQLDPGVRELLSLWRDAGVPTAWVTDFTTEQQLRKLQTLSIADSVTYLVTAEEVGAVKPDPRGVDEALARFGIAPGPGVWFIGDDPKRDRGVAEARGLTFLWRDRTDKGFWDRLHAATKW
ncbi:HAD family hydrolase [Armatimonas rosea]|uniref:FMN phosphatase YigB (HAD superfamily) n=1 Tax=Armatimonas rosea TaxID=685828 RepID=A0A7W9W5L0_ARMRO|nr:HAD family hydrolase [Armatimonas rosea]MBB6048677.1 FMN phosphatase YigB (HAD superfamily) [Armatimonas rosea]